MRKLLLLLLGLILFLLLGYWCINKTTAPAIQKDINNRVTQSLHDANLSSVNVITDGRDLTLSGVVTHKKHRIAAEQVAKIKGVRTIENQVIINSLSQPSDYYFTIEKGNTNEVTLKGHIPDSTTHHNLISYVKELFQTHRVKDHLKVQKNAPKSWTSVSKTGIDALNLLETGHLTVTEGQLLIVGEAATAQTLERIKNKLTTLLPEGYKKNIDINLEPQLELQTDASIETNNNDKSSNTHSQAIISECENKLKQSISIINITFETGSTDIKSSLSTGLNELAKIKSECPNQALVIRGHTDNRGDSSFNLKLSEKRAMTVKNYLISKDVNGEHITAQGLGETLPIANNNTRAGQKMNRRIEIIVKEIVQ